MFYTPCVSLQCTNSQTKYKPGVLGGHSLATIGFVSPEILSRSAPLTSVVPFSEIEKEEPGMQEPNKITVNLAETLLTKQKARVLISLRRLMLLAKTRLS